jgi:acyl-CoA synthetase (NDP forming)
MKKGVYTEFDTEKFLKKFVPVAKNKLCRTNKEVEEGARKVGFPLVLKLISKDALHKSDIGGVRIVNYRLDLEKELRELTNIIKKHKIKAEGILVQEFVEGESVLIGLKQDKSFGHAIVLGIGGIYTEYLKDVSFRVCPVTKKDVNEMIDELKMKSLLFGVRGRKSVNLDLLKDVVVKVSRIPLKHKEIKELDINPFVIDHQIGKVVDARMVI